MIRKPGISVKLGGHVIGNNDITRKNISESHPRYGENLFPLHGYSRTSMGLDSGTTFVRIFDVDLPG